MAEPPRGSLRVFGDPEALAQGAAQEIDRRVRARLCVAPRFTLALSGGSTPARLYRLLASQPLADSIPWERVHVFWGDERVVPPHDPRSNYRLAYDALLGEVAIPPANIHRFRAELPDVEEARLAYEAELREFFAEPEGGGPQFDLVLLGMGADGHIASLFPGSEALDETRRWVSAPRVKGLDAVRLTLTLPVLNQARCVLFLVAGGSKAEVLRDVLRGDPSGSGGRYPAAMVDPVDGELWWYVDQEAAAMLDVD